MKGLIIAIAFIALGVWVHSHFPEETKAVGHGVAVIARGLINAVQELSKESDSPKMAEAKIEESGKNVVAKREHDHK